ncbi:MAG TPA: alpha/beta fold hydrolase [Gemmatimonadaceae bacterium]|nr:alpha/beta fold hydrolase [Gemmatimonadaceae bacterium]
MTSIIDRDAYPFESHWLKIDRGRVHYVDEGQGKDDTIVFVHGTPTWSFEWRHLISALSSSHRCIALDHLGFGLSDRPRGVPYTPEWHADNFAQFIERLNPGPFTLVVHDYGWPIAFPFVIAHPELVKRVVIINSWMWSFAGDREMESKGKIAGSFFGRLLYRWANFSLRVLTPGVYGDRKKLTKQIHRQYLERFTDRWSRGAVLWPLARALLRSSAFFDAQWQQRGKLETRPVLIIWGRKDSAFKPHQLARWRGTLPSARVVELPAAGHWPQEEDPEAVLAAITPFVSIPARAVATR